jgi:hypothetical protein
MYVKLQKQRHAKCEVKGFIEKGNLGKECVKAMDFLPFFNKSVELTNSLKCKFIHKVDNIWFRQILALEFLDSHRKCC